MNADGARNEEQQQDLQQRARPPEDQDGGDDHHRQQPPPLRCPRCDSSNTKFCYYNNYSLSQPRYFCKACRRYWTQGGTLRSVPVGGGCRKAKRPRISSSSSSSALSAGLIPRTGGLSTLSQSLIPAQPRLPPPVDQPFGGSFYAGGSFLSTLAAMQTLPPGGVNQGATVMGGGRGRFGTNMALLHGVSFPPWRSPAPPPNHFIPPQQNLVLPGRFGSWSPRVINDGATSSSAAASSGLWSSSGAGGSDQTGSSFTPNQWSTDCNSRFNPSSD